MNLKEAFRYQKFLDRIFSSAECSISERSHMFKTIKTHLKSAADPDAEDIVEEVEVDPFFPCDSVISLMQHLVVEKEKLTEAINKAKASVDFDIDAAVASNKYRQRLAADIRRMLQCKPLKRTESGRGYKFNVEGNQAVYYYDVETVQEELFDRKADKDVMLRENSTADRYSAEVDAALINTVVDYEPEYDCSESFDDVMESFLTAF